MDTPMPKTESAAEAEETQTEVTEESTDTTPEGAEALGDAGKRALDAMKAQRKALKDEVRSLKAEIESLRAPKEDPTGQPDADAIRREVMSAANTRILKSEIKAAAKGVLNDPADAFRYLDLDRFDVDENGEIDAEDIADAIADLAKERPYLAAKAIRFQGTGDGGAARKASGPSQLKREDLKGMSPEQIGQAKKEGRLKDLLSGK